MHVEHCEAGMKFCCHILFWLKAPILLTDICFLLVGLKMWVSIADPMRRLFSLVWLNVVGFAAYFAT